jgi:hypothetical protein
MEFLVIAAVCVGMYLFLRSTGQRLDDPTNRTVVYTDQMRSVHMLGQGPVSAALIRQSGNLHRELGAFHTVEDALHEIEKAFRRANIDSVVVVENGGGTFRVVRRVPNFRGRAEGKKLGGAIIVRH